MSAAKKNANNETQLKERLIRIYLNRCDVVEWVQLHTIGNYVEILYSDRM